MTTETPMRERIARLLARLGDDREENWPNWTNCADAVLDAMREPTPSLLQALSREWESEGRRTMLDNWRAAIDAAKEGK